MNFTDAVRELAEGRCEGIKREGQTEYYTLKGFTIIWDSTEDMYPDVAHFLADDWQLVNPKPVMEPVDVVAWQCPVCSRLYSDEDHSKTTPSVCCDDSNLNGTFIKLTGTILRPVAKKVKRRERTATCIRGHHVPASANLAMYWEWEE